MASEESESNFPEPWMNIYSNDDSKRPYYLKTKGKERTRSHPYQLSSKDGEIATRTCPSPTHSPSKKIVDKESSSESVYVTCHKAERPCLKESVTAQRNATNKEKYHKIDVKEITEKKSEEEHDDENIKTDNKPKTVDLCEAERKPVSFSLKSKKVNIKVDNNQLAQTSKPKLAIHPTILAFQKLAKTVRWSQSNKKQQKSGNSIKSKLSQKIGDDSKGEKKENNLDTLRKIIRTEKTKENKCSAAVFKMRKKRPNKVVEETVKSLVDPCYHSNEEKDSSRSKKQKLEHVHEQSVAELDVPTEVVSPVSSIEHKRQLTYTTKTKTPSDIEHFVACEQYQYKCLSVNRRKHKEPEYNFSKSKQSREITRDKHNNEFAQDVDEVTEMEVDVQEIIDEITSFRGNPSHWNSEISRLSVDYDMDSKSVYYVTDTNILLQDIGFLDDLKIREIDGRSIIIVIPYVVLRELDGLKKSHSVGMFSSKAIAWCNKHFERNDKRVVGQIYDDYLKTLSENPRNSADDLIRDCCLLMKRQNLDVVLLTNDTNLRNKAILSQIRAVGAKMLRKTLETKKRTVLHDLQSVLKDDCKSVKILLPPEMMSINYHNATCTISPSKRSLHDLQKDDCKAAKTLSPPEMMSINYHEAPSSVSQPKKRSVQKDRTDLLEKIKTSLCITLGYVLEVAFKESYGEDLWLKIIIHKPPWTLDQVFSCWEKHWLAVFIDKFKSEVRDLVRKIRNCLKCTNTKECVETLEKDVRVLYTFFDNPEYKHCVLPLNLYALEEKEIKSTVAEQEKVNQSIDGVAHAKEMMNLVGSHITHVLAMICDAFEVPHTLNRLNDGQLSREDAASSAVNLHDVIMELGNAVVSCLSSATSVSLRELGTLLVGFWRKANNPCPDLPFTEESLCIISTSSDGQKYLQLVAGELERLLNILKSIMNM